MAFKIEQKQRKANNRVTTQNFILNQVVPLSVSDVIRDEIRTLVRKRFELDPDIEAKLVEAKVSLESIEAVAAIQGALNIFDGGARDANVERGTPAVAFNIINNFERFAQQRKAYAERRGDGDTTIGKWHDTFMQGVTRFQQDLVIADKLDKELNLFDGFLDLYAGRKKEDVDKLLGIGPKTAAPKPGAKTAPKAATIDVDEELD